MSEFVICPQCDGTGYTPPPENVFVTIGLVGADPHVVIEANGTTCPKVSIHYQTCHACWGKGYLETKCEEVE